MGNYVLGLDLGPTSIGWAAIDVNDKGELLGFSKIKNADSTITALGARIFEAGINNLGQGQREESKNKKCREKRSVRRNLRRKRARKLKLIALLKQHGVIKEESLDMLYQNDPYELRVKALNEQLPLEHLGRIILHITKRRGFKSNRKQAEKGNEAGLIKEAMKKLEASLGTMTLGKFWHQQLKIDKHKPIRNRHGSYNWVAQRSQYKQELGLIYEKQSQFYRDVLTESLFNQISDLLFDQIPFELSRRKKKKIIGTCSLIKGQLRCPLSERIAQEFRLLQKINDLIVTIDGIERPLEKDEREKIYQELMNSKERTFNQIRKLFDWDEEVTFNFEHTGNDKLTGNSIDSMLASKTIFDKKVWQKLTEDTKESVWQFMLQHYFSENSDLTEEQAAYEIEQKFGLKVKNIDSFGKLDPPVGVIRYSKKALLRLLPFMRQGLSLYDAIAEAGFERKWRHLKRLPLPDKTNGFQITNPVVSTVLYQLRKVVNSLINELGKPQAIIIETTRALKANKDRRQDIIKTQKQNQNERALCEKRIREYMGWNENVQVSLTDITKYRLWEEQQHYCPYSCKKIGIAELLSRDTEIDHILPYSMSLDNSLSNKVVCFTKENQDKGQRTPIDWLGENSTQFQKIRDAIDNQRFGKNNSKWERFFVHSQEIAENYTPERLLRDTSYVATEVRSYLQRLYPYKIATQKVKTTKGGITAQLRNVWQLDPMLREGEVGPKNRDDLRHHAVDAAVIAATSPSMIKKITDVLKKNPHKRPSHIDNIPQPWQDYDLQLAESIGQTSVSHCVRRKVRGQLHEETIFNKENFGPNKDKFVTRKKLDKQLTMATAKSICDPAIRQLVIDRLNQFDGKADKAFDEPLMLPSKKENGKATPIRSVRVFATSNTMIQIKENIWVEPGSNHHVEIFKAKVKGKETLIRRVYSTWEISQRLQKLAKNVESQKKSHPIITREHPFPDDPTITDVEFWMSLSRGESVILKNEEGKEVLARVGKISYGSDSPTSIYITFLEHQLSGVNGNITQKTPNAYCIRSMAGFYKTVVGKVTVDPLGRIRRAND